jgi:hypothetical protein
MNDNVYTGNLAHALQLEGLLMEEQILRSTVQEAPCSHQTGQVAMMGTFGTPEIRCTNSYLSSYEAGVGDHHFQAHDFGVHSILGTEYPKTTQPSGCHCIVRLLTPSRSTTQY